MKKYRKTLLNLALIAVPITLVSCATQQATDRVAQSVGMAQYEFENGVRYQLCTSCPVSTPKTMYGMKRVVEKDQAKVFDLKTADEEKIPDKGEPLKAMSGNTAIKSSSESERRAFVMLKENVSEKAMERNMLKVLFRRSRTTLTRQGQETIDAYFKSLQDEGLIESIESIAVVGFTDTFTDGHRKDHYQRLFERSRARAIKTYLKKNFFPRKEIIATASGDTGWLYKDGLITEARSKIRGASIFINFKSTK